jgi:hypothetical protein
MFLSLVVAAIQSTPPIEQPPIEQPRPRKRKKQYFDDPVVLSNKYDYTKYSYRTNISSRIGY